MGDHEKTYFTNAFKQEPMIEWKPFLIQEYERLKAKVELLNRKYNFTNKEDLEIKSLEIFKDFLVNLKRAGYITKIPGVKIVRVRQMFEKVEIVPSIPLKELQTEKMIKELEEIYND